MVALTSRAGTPYCGVSLIYHSHDSVFARSWLLDKIALPFALSTVLFFAKAGVKKCRLTQ
jgi:hypothetical protein